MNKEQLAEQLKTLRNGKPFKGDGLTAYAIESIESGRSSYPVSNLLAYCAGLGLQMKLNDWATDDDIPVDTVLDVHKALDTLMKRYQIDYKLVYRYTGSHYTAPKSFDEEELKRLQSKGKEKGKKYVTPLSIKTLLDVCSVIHCELKFVWK